MVNYILAAYFWVLFILTTCVLFVYLCGVFAYHRIFDAKNASHAAHNVAVLWGQTLFALGPAWTHQVRARENLPPEQGEPYVIVANHSSTADIWALYLIGIQFRWLSKDTMFRVPLVGIAMKWAGYVPVKRGHKQSQYLALQSSREWLRSGVSMAFFPEGTRSLDGNVKEFKVGAFRLAQEENKMIVPVVLRGTRDMLVKNSGFPRKAHLDIEILPPTRSLEGEDTQAFAKRVRDMIALRLTQAVPEQPSPITTSMKKGTPQLS